MPPIDGRDVTIQVAATAIAAGTPVNGLTRFSRRRSAGVNRTAVFMRSTPYVSQQQRTHSFTVSGLRINDDAGQVIIRDAEAARTSVFLTVLWDGTNGFKQEVLPTELSDDANPEALTDYGFTFEGVDEPTIVGTGPLN
jgi:hypothetical protein